MTEYRPIKLKVTNGRRIEYQGSVVAEYSTHRDGKQKWEEARLWETPGGAWIAERRGVSTLPGQERDIVSAKVIYPEQVGVDEAQHQAMLVWTYSDAAYALAKILGWDPVDRPE